MNRMAFRLSVAAAAALVASMTAAIAQTTDPHHEGGPMGADMGRMMEMMRPMMAGGMGMPFEHVEGRIAYLKAELKVTDAQSAAWNAFADTIRAEAAAMKTMHDGMATAGMPTAMPDRMAAQREMMSARMGMMERSETSMRALYAALSADQRKSFDQIMSGPMGMM